MIKLEWTGDGLIKLEQAVEALGDEGRARAAYRMALNDTRKRIFTQVKRVVAKQMGTTQATIAKQLHQVPATSGKLVTSIDAKGGYLPLKAFKPRQGKAGVSASPWGSRALFPSTFIVGKGGGQVFKNTGNWNAKASRFNGIEALWGPALPKEIVRDASKTSFESISSTRLPAEVARQINRLTSGTVS